MSANPAWRAPGCGSNRIHSITRIRHAGERQQHVPHVLTVTESRTFADLIEDLLPQTQCTKCGYPDCRAYAEAIARDEASYNQCPPGGAEGVARLAKLLGKPVIP